MPCVRFRDKPWVGKCIHAERERILNASRMEPESEHDYLYLPVIEALDVLLEHITDEDDDAVWKADALHAYGQLILSAFQDSDRCDLFLSVVQGFQEAGLDLAVQ